MLYQWICEKIRCERMFQIVECNHVGGLCESCKSRLVLKDDSNQLRAAIAQATALQAIATAVQDSWLYVKIRED